MGTGNSGPSIRSLLRVLSIFLVRKVLSTPTMLGFLAVLPAFAEGSTFHEAAESFRKYGSLGLLNSAAFMWWGKFVIAWSEARGMDWSGDLRFLPRFLLAYLIPLPLATLLNYFALRIFESMGEWKVVFTLFSRETLVSSLVLCGFCVAFTLLVVPALTLVSRGEHPFMAAKKPPARWKIMLILSGILGFPLGCLLLGQAIAGMS